MATDETVRQIGAKAKKARERIPGVRESVKQKNARQVAAGLSAIDKDLEELLKLTGEDSEPDEPDEPDDTDLPDPPDPPGEPGAPVQGWAYTLANIPSAGLKTVANKTFTDASWMKQANTRFVNIRLVGDAATDSEDIADNIQLINLTVENNKGHTVSDSGMRYIFYLNPGRKEVDSNFVMLNGTVKNCSGTEFIESKGHNVKIINVDFTQSPGIKNGVRIRFGADVLILNCPGLKRITGRGHHSAAVNCPHAAVTLFGGNLPGDVKKWLPLHKAGKGKYQRAEHWYVAGCKTVLVGAPSTKSDTYPALGCVLAPGQQFKPGKQQGMQQRLIGSLKELQGLREME